MRYAPVWLFQVCNASNTWPSDASSIVFCQLMQHKVASRSPYGRRRLSNSKWRRRGRKLNCAPNLRKWRVSRGAFMRRTAEEDLESGCNEEKSGFKLCHCGGRKSELPFDADSLAIEKNPPSIPIPLIFPGSWICNRRLSWVEQTTPSAAMSSASKVKKRQAKKGLKGGRQEEAALTPWNATAICNTCLIASLNETKLLLSNTRSC